MRKKIDSSCSQNARNKKNNALNDTQRVAEKRRAFSVHLHVPNAKTRKALEDIQEGKGLETTSLQELAKDWDDACVK